MYYPNIAVIRIARTFQVTLNSIYKLNKRQINKGKTTVNTLVEKKKKSTVVEKSSEILRQDMDQYFLLVFWTDLIRLFSWLFPDTQ